MADTNAGGAGGNADDTEKGAEGTGTENKGTDAGAAGDESSAGDDKDESGDGTGDGDDDDDKAPADDGAEPVTRRKPIDYILERKDRKIAKLSGKGGNKGAAEGDESGDDSGAGEGDGEDDVAQEDKEIVLRTVKPLIEPLLKQQAEQQDAQELSKFLTERPEFKPYEAQIKRFMAHPSRAHLPVKAIAYEVAGDKLIAIGAKKAKAADDKAKGTQAGGGSGRESGTGGKSVWDMTPAEFAAEQQRIRTSRR